MAFNTDKEIIQREDGTFVIDHEGAPYHVCSREDDPYNIYDLDEVRAFAEAHPELVRSDGPTLEEVKQGLKAKIEVRLSGLLYAGFAFDGEVYPADIQAQTAAIDAGQDYADTGETAVLGAFCKANTWVPMIPAKFAEFRTTGRAFVRGLFARVWHLKHEQIKNAQTKEEAEAFFDQWLGE